MNIKQPYCAPLLSVVTFTVECGFLGSQEYSAPANLNFEVFESIDDAHYNSATTFENQTWNW